MKRTIAVLMTVLSLGMGGCGTMQKYNSKYIDFNPELLSTTKRGKVLIVTSQYANERLYDGNKGKLQHKSIRQNEIYLGQYVKNIALEIFDKAFNGGAKHLNEMPKNMSEYRIIIRPKIDYFKEGHKGWVLEFTPLATVSINVRFYNSKGEKILEKIYTSGLLKGGIVFSETTCLKETNKVIHRAIVKNMEQILRDANSLLDK